MKKRLLYSAIFFMTIFTMVIIASCNKKFDAPPFGVAPNITANKTIAGLKSLYQTTGTVVTIDSNYIIEGVISANDKSGNNYKEIFLQDATGGIALKLNGTNLYSSYPVGMQLFVNCKGLSLSDYHNDIELGVIDNTVPSSPTVTGIPSQLFTNYLVAGTLINPIVPKVVTITQLNTAASNPPFQDSLQNTLIQIQTAQFVDTTGLIYSDTSTAKGSVSRTIQDCSGNTTVAYTSGYASFAGVKLPYGGGSITAIYIPYNATTELLISDTSAVKFTGARCNGSSPNSVISLAALRAMYTGTTITSLGAYTVHGVVISNAATTNISAGNVVIQDGTSGVTVYFGSVTIPYHVGDSVVINATGAKLQSYLGGGLELDPKGTPPTAVATGKVIVPLKTTTANLIANITTMEETLVEIDNATAPSGTYSGNKIITDASGPMSLYTLSGATFASTALPTVASNYIGYGTRYPTGNELHIRSTADVTPFGGSTQPPSGGNTKRVADIRALYTGASVTLPVDTIHGVVISDAATKNIGKGSVVIQDGNSGILVYFGSVTLTYNIGDSIVIAVTGGTLKSYMGALEIDYPTNAVPPTPVATGITITPKVLTTAQVTSQLSSVEYTLVTVQNATVSGTGTTYSGPKTLTDASGNITLYTSSGATYSGTTFPTTAKSFTGYPVTFNATTELEMRDPSIDVQ
jgi:DNA-directed RNA polymerase subunit E'/Rpb7